VLCKFTGQNESHTRYQTSVSHDNTEGHEVDSRGLDLSGRDGGFFVIRGEFGRFGGDALKDV